MTRLAALIATAAVASSAAAGPAQTDRHRRGAIATADKTSEPAAQPIALTELIAAAVQHSPALAMAHADYEESRNRDAAAGAVDEWHLNGQFNGQDVQLDRTLASPSVALDTRQLNASVGLGRSLSTGGDIAVTATTGQASYVYPGPGSSARSSVNDLLVSGTTASARIDATQPLLRGAGASVARADQHTTRLAAHTQAADAHDDAAALVRDLVVGYWELAYDVQSLAVDRDGEALARHQVTITQDVVRAGLQPPSALMIAELQVALRREAVLRDEIAIVDHSLAVRKLAGIEMTTVPLTPSDPLQVPTARWTEADAVAATLARGPLLSQKKLAQLQADIAIDLAKDKRLPRLDLKLSGELDGVGGSTGAAFSQIGDAQAYSVIASLAFQWDLGPSAYAATRAARFHRVRVDAERSDLEHQMTSSAMSQVHQFRLAAQRIELSELAVSVAEEALRAEVVAFQGGRSTNVLVFQREDDVAQAKLRLARARIDAIEANAQLDYLTGGLLERYGVAIDSARRSS
jgi:outer membrane protein TolC